MLARLLNVSRETQEDYQSLLTRYVGERFLFRLGSCAHRDRFLLKGAYLLTLSIGESPFRLTKDIDLLSEKPSSSQELSSILREICLVPSHDDGVVFDVDEIEIRVIREGARHQGLRALIPVRIGSARLKLQLDVGEGDVVYPSATELHVPPILDGGAPLVRAYPIETVVAEKLEAIVSLSFVTSRMKDFFDLHAISTHFEIQFESLSAAVERTFKRRRTTLPTSVPPILTDEVLRDPNKSIQWNAFLRKSRAGALDFGSVLERIRAFSSPLWELPHAQGMVWMPDSGWAAAEDR